MAYTLERSPDSLRFVSAFLLSGTHIGLFNGPKKAPRCVHGAVGAFFWRKCHENAPARSARWEASNPV